RALAADPRERIPTAGGMLDALGSATGEGHATQSANSRFLTHLAVAIIGTPVALIGLGSLSSRAFNAAVGRSDFAAETVSDWVFWGASSCLGPAVLLLMAFASLGLLMVLRRIALTISIGAQELDAAARRRLDQLA